MTDTMTADEYRKSQRKGSKYRNKKVRIDGIVFDSIVEGARYIDLKRLEMYARIANLTLQPVFELRGESGEVVARYRADFSYYDVGQDGVKGDELIVEDVKGMETDVFRIKRKWVETDYGIRVRIVTRDEVDTSGMEQYVVEPHAARPAVAEGQGA